MNLSIYALINGVNRRVTKTSKDKKEVETIIDTIKSQGYKIGGIDFKFHLEFNDVISLNEREQRNTRSIVVIPV